MSTNAVIELRNITKTYTVGGQDFHALKGVDIHIEQKELVAIMGSSGSGKSTMLNILGLLDRPSSGQYHLSGTDVSHFNDDELADFRNHKIGFVFQSFFLLPRFTALQNITLSLSYRGMDHAHAEEKAHAMLDKMGIARLANSKPNAMSGGQQQRVAIARALVGEPDLILADEPTGALDSKTSDAVMDVLTHLNKNENKTVVIVTHDPEVGAACDRIIHLADGEVSDGL